MQVFKAIITEVYPHAEYGEISESEVFSGYFSTVAKAQEALRAAWSGLGIGPYAEPALDGPWYEHRGSNADGLLHVAEVNTIQVDPE